MQYAIAVLIAAASLVGAGCRSMSSPLHPGQEALTGGRAALSQWEFYDALAQMYRAQVMLNVVRLVEYGEAPLHFEFSDITAKVTDQASIGSGFSFLDSPVGGSVVGNVFVATPDTNVTFTPSISTSRKVEIQAKATPVVRNNWIYNWYYTIADQFTDHTRLSSKGRANERAFYERISGATKFGRDFWENLKGRLSLWYRGDLYVIKESYKSPFEVDGFTLRRSPFPAEELGGLTAIVTFLQPSDPREASGAFVEIPARFGRVGAVETPPDSAAKRLYISPKLEHADPTQFQNLQRELRLIEAELTKKAQKVTVQFPIDPAGKYFVREYMFADLHDDLTWELLIPDDEAIQKELINAYNMYALLPASPSKRITARVTIRTQLGRISTTDAARRISGAPALAKTKDEKALLKSILTVLERNEFRNNP